MDTDTLTRSICCHLSTRSLRKIKCPQYRRVTHGFLTQLLVFSIAWFMVVDMCTVRWPYRLLYEILELCEDDENLLNQTGSPVIPELST